MSVFNVKRSIGWKCGAALLVVAVCAAQTTLAEDANGIEVAGNEESSGSLAYYDTSGGSILAAYKATLFSAFSDKTGVAIKDDFHNGDTAFFAAANKGRMPWSVVAFNTVADGLRAAEQGYLLPLDESVVPLTKLAAGAYGEYGIRAVAYGMVLTWNTDKWPLDGKHPASWQDFYDVDTFPGRRCLYEGPQSGWVLESALMADGVAAEALYPLDIERALKKLDTIRRDIAWWSTGTESIEKIGTGKCDMGILWSGRVLSAVQDRGLPLAVTWKGAGYTSDFLAVPEGAPNPRAGFAFLAHWISDRQGQIAFVNQTGYPTNIKGIALSDYDESVQDFLAAGRNLESAVPVNDDYYREHIARLITSFSRWREEGAAIRSYY